MRDFDGRRACGGLRREFSARRGRALAAAVLAAVAGAGLSSCAGSRGTRDVDAAGMQAAGRTLHVLPDGRVVFVQDKRPRWFRRPPVERVVLPDGERLDVEYAWVMPDAEATPPALPGLASASGWSGVEPTAWTERWRPKQKQMPGFWITSSKLPVEPLGGMRERVRSVKLGDESYRVVWLEPGALEIGTSRRPAGTGGWGATALAELATVPRWRWRAGLARASVGWTVDPTDTSSEAGWTPALQMLTRQEEWAWSAALERLRSADPDLAQELRDSLGGVIEFPGSVAVPVWTGQEEDIDRLLEELLAPGRDDEAARRAAREFLAGQPRTLAWVADDAGAIDGVTGAPVSMVWVANMRNAPAAVSAGPDAARSGGKSASAVLSTVPAWSARMVAAPMAKEMGLPGAKGEWARVAVEAGSFRVTRAVRAPIPARPPGVNIGPLVVDWTMPALAAFADAPEDSLSPEAGDETGAPESGWLTAARLHRDAGGVAASGEEIGAEAKARAAARGWVVYLECREPERGEKAEGEHVALWLGGFGSAKSVLEVRPSGAVRDLRDASREPGSAKVTRTERGWACWVSVPPEAVEIRGGRATLRLGVVRVDSRGVRTAWPRPMLPWQVEPGRAAVDLSAW